MQILQSKHVIYRLLQEYKCKSVLQNTMQISKQFKYLQSQYKRGFIFKDYHLLSENDLLSMEYEIQSAVKAKEYQKAVSMIFSSFVDFHNRSFCINNFNFRQNWHINSWIWLWVELIISKRITKIFF